MAQRRASRSERAYGYLMEEVLRGRWNAGETLSTYAMSEEIGISRTPVIEALKRLESEGLVEIIPQVGFRIVGPSTGTVEELFAVRGVLEGLAAQEAARQIDQHELAELEIVLRQLEGAVESGDRSAAGELNHRFHMRVVEASRMPRLIETARSVWAPLRYQLERLPTGADELRRSIPEHREVYDALRRHAPKRARAATERHAKLSAARFMSRMQPDGPNGLVHQCLIYDADADYVAAAAPFVAEGLKRGERVLAVTMPGNAAALTRALGRDAAEVEFRDAEEWYQLPSHTLLSYERYIEYSDRSRARVTAELPSNGNGSGAMAEWVRYEAVLNVAFALEPVSFLCTYDARALPAGVVADARRAHPRICTGAESAPNPDFADFATLTRELDREGLDEPDAPTAGHAIGPDLRSVRRFVLDQAHRAGLSAKRVQDAFLAVQEVAANVVAHGSDRSAVRAWVQDGELVYEVRDEGIAVGDSIVGEFAADPALGSDSRGLWIARLLCDLVEVRSDGDAVVVRLHVSLD